MNTTTPTANETPNETWQPCRPGEFADLSKRLRSRRLRRTVFQTSVAATLGLLIVGGLWATRPQQEKEYHFAGISCSRVWGLAPALKMNKLEPGLRDQVRAHVMECPRCQARFKAMGMAVSNVDHRFQRLKSSPRKVISSVPSIMTTRTQSLAESQRDARTRSGQIDSSSWTSKETRRAFPSRVKSSTERRDS